MCIHWIEFLAEGGLKVENAVIFNGCSEQKKGKSGKSVIA
jgi:hypothetical protein